MSRIGNKPISIPAGVDVRVDGTTVHVKGPKGEAVYAGPSTISVKVDGGDVVVDRSGETKPVRAMHGTVRSLVSNMIEGVTNGYTRELELQGVGFRAQVAGKVLNLNLGYSHPINFPIPDGLDITVNNNTEIVITGVDKQMVGQAAAQIRAYYKAEPYKGKGVRYKGEVVRRKVGKAVA